MGAEGTAAFFQKSLDRERAIFSGPNANKYGCYQPSWLYLDRVFCRTLDRDSVKCPQFHVITFTNHKFVTRTPDLDKSHRKGSGYWMLDASFPARQASRDRIRTLVERPLMGDIIIKKW